MTGSEHLGGLRPSTAEGDPGKFAYLRNPNWTGTPMIHGIQPDPRLCPGCLFDSPKWPHVNDGRCKLFTERMEAD
jgi:hypothetical protein